MRLSDEAYSPLQSLAAGLTSLRLLARRGRSNRHRSATPTPDWNRYATLDAPAPHLSIPCEHRPHISRSFVAFGTAQDRTAFTTVIRAFALAGRWGDRLTLVGTNPHRRRLEKWINALRLDNAVSFADSNSPRGEHVTGHDIAILVSPRPDQAAVLLNALLSGLSVLSTDKNDEAATLLGRASVGTTFRPHDVMALTHALLIAAQPDRHTVRRLLTYQLAPGASYAAGVRSWVGQSQTIDQHHTVA